MKKTAAEIAKELSNPNIKPGDFNRLRGEFERATAEEKEAPLDDAYAQCFSTDAGKKVLADLIRRHPPAASRFKDENGKYDPDPIAAGMRDGAAAVVAAIHGRLKRAPNYKIPID